MSELKLPGHMGLSVETWKFLAEDSPTSRTPIVRQLNLKTLPRKPKPVDEEKENEISALRQIALEKIEELGETARVVTSTADIMDSLYEEISQLRETLAYAANAAYRPSAESHGIFLRESCARLGIPVGPTVQITGWTNLPRFRVFQESAELQISMYVKDGNERFVRNVPTRFDENDRPVIFAVNFGHTVNLEISSQNMLVAETGFFFVEQGAHDLPLLRNGINLEKATIQLLISDNS